MKYAWTNQSKLWTCSRFRSRPICRKKIQHMNVATNYSSIGSRRTLKKVEKMPLQRCDSLIMELTSHPQWFPWSVKTFRSAEEGSYIQSIWPLQRSRKRKKEENFFPLSFFKQKRLFEKQSAFFKVERKLAWNWIKRCTIRSCWRPLW